MHTITVVLVSKSQNNRYWPWIQVQYFSTYSLLGLDNDFCDRVSLLWVYMVRPFWHLRPHWSLLRVACTTSMFIYALYSYWPNIHLYSRHCRNVSRKSRSSAMPSWCSSTGIVSLHFLKSVISAYVSMFNATQLLIDNAQVDDWTFLYNEYNLWYHAHSCDVPSALP